MTLIEVVAGLALLGSLLAGVLLTKAKYTRQSRAADRRALATSTAGRLLAGWWLDAKTFPRAGAGVADDFRWRLSAVPDRAARELGGQIVRLTLYDPSAALPEAPVLSVDVVLPAEEKANEKPSNQSLQPR